MLQKLTYRKPLIILLFFALVAGGIGTAPGDGGWTRVDNPQCNPC